MYMLVCTAPSVFNVQFLFLNINKFGEQHVMEKHVLRQLQSLGAPKGWRFNYIIARIESNAVEVLHISCVYDEQTRYERIWTHFAEIIRQIFLNDDHNPYSDNIIKHADIYYILNIYNIYRTLNKLSGCFVREDVTWNIERFVTVF